MATLSSEFESMQIQFIETLQEIHQQMSERDEEAHQASSLLRDLSEEVKVFQETRKLSPKGPAPSTPNFGLLVTPSKNIFEKDRRTS